MTELEKIKRAQMYIDKMVKGINPITDTEIPKDDTLNNVRIMRCLIYVNEVLEKVIENDGYIGKSSRPRREKFSTTPEEINTLVPSDNKLPISVIADNINEALHKENTRKIPATKITNWLLSKGFLELISISEGKNKRIPSEAGLALGITSEIRNGARGEYLAILYDRNAQQFIFDNLIAILEEK